MATILSVEDIAGNQILMTRKLKREGYKVLTAENGVEALQVAREETIDLILMDLEMPVMDGFQATRILKSQPGTRHVPIIAVTGYVPFRDEAIAAGCDAFHAKPIDWERLLSLIASLLPAPAAR